MDTCFIIQARIGSTRLPGKILLPFDGQKSILDLLIEKLSAFKNIGIVVATSVAKENDAIEMVANKHHVHCYRGAEQDVLRRFIEAAHSVNAKHIIRICSDNPFLELNSIRQLIELVTSCQEQGGLDYASFDICGQPSIKTHYGFWTEYTSLSALEKVAHLTDDLFYHEHVTNYIYAHSDIFKIRWLSGSEVLIGHENIRLTIDTADDFRNAQAIYADLCAFNPFPTIKDIVAYLDTHPNYYQSMKNQITVNSKK